MKASEKQIDEFTLNDVHVGLKLFDALVAHAKHHPGQPIVYSDLLANAKAADTADEELKRAVPIGIGPKLFFVREFCKLNDYPNLACLGVNKKDLKPGGSYDGDWQAEMQRVAAFDWSAVKAKLTRYATTVKERVTPRKRVPEKGARELVWEYYDAHRSQYSTIPREEMGEIREEIVNLVMEGFDVAVAFQRVLAAAQSSS